ncbi:MAG: hypothetical protein GC162_01620 [Planctomycetes bacterium]|nr:hypothetical protein [Planctomycetota bacterium]
MMTRRTLLAGLVSLCCIVSAHAADAAKVKLMIIVSEPEYNTAESLPKFAADRLSKDFDMTWVKSAAEDENDLSGMEKLDDMDMVLISVRRRTPTLEQMAALKRFVAAGKPVVGIRTASHAFALRKGDPPAGHAVWPTFDADVLGCHYDNHYANAEHPVIRAAAGADDNPLLRGVKLPFTAGWSMYKSHPLVATATPLLMGTIPDHDPEPVAWTNRRADGGRVFYTSLGHVDDFANESFDVLLRNGIYWAAGREIPDK